MKIPGTDYEVEFEPLRGLPAGLLLGGAHRGRTDADAVLVPVGYRGITEDHATFAALQYRFGGAIAGEGALYVRDPAAGRRFVTRNPHDSMMHPKMAPRNAGQQRYDWYPDPDEPGVSYGFLRK